MAAQPLSPEVQRLPVISRVRAKTLRVGRLDGPTPAIARRLVDDALEVEKTGLNGIFYLDARGLKGQAAPGNYVWFDQHLLRLSDLLKKYSGMKVVLDGNLASFPRAPAPMPPSIAVGIPWPTMCPPLPGRKARWVITWPVPRPPP